MPASFSGGVEIPPDANAESARGGGEQFLLQAFRSFAEAANSLDPETGSQVEVGQRFHMAGDQLTYWSGWQEGALLSAQAAVASIDRIAKAETKR